MITARARCAEHGQRLVEPASLAAGLHGPLAPHPSSAPRIDSLDARAIAKLMKFRCAHDPARPDSVSRRCAQIVVQLNGRLNKCGCISPRYDVQVGDMERLTNRLLPSRLFGYVVLTTSAGIMDHEEARRKHLGGKVIGFFY